MSDDELAKLALDYYRLAEGGTCRLMATPVNHACQLARRLLELLPAADDGEMVTGEWLNASGFQSDGYANPWFRHESAAGIVVRFKTGLDPVISLAGYGLVSVAATRGAVRRLCAALGVTLREPNQ